MKILAPDLVWERVPAWNCDESVLLAGFPDVEMGDYDNSEAVVITPDAQEMMTTGNWIGDLHPRTRKILEKKPLMLWMPWEGPDWNLIPASGGWRNGFIRLQKECAKMQVVIISSTSNLGNAMQAPNVRVVDDWLSLAFFFRWGTEVAWDESDSPQVEHRHKHMVCLNRVSKWHRMEVVRNITQAGHLDRCHLSSAQSRPPLILDTDDWDNDAYFISNTGLEWYRDSYINVVTESHTNGSVMFSEKIWKPILNLQPFIVVGQLGYLSELRRRGFRTWSSYLDESYDEIEDAYERVDVVCREINRLLSMSLEEIRTLYLAAWPDILYNQKTLQLHLDKPFLFPGNV